MKYGVIIFLFLTNLQLLAQGGWVREKNSFFVKQDVIYFQSDNYINLEGDELETSKFEQTTLFLYGEYGITERLALNTSFPIYRWNGFETTEKVGGIGDLRLELEYALFKGNYPTSLSIAPEIPTGPDQLLAQNTENVFDMANLPTGDGEFNVWSTLAVSRSLNKLPIYFSSFTAYNYRTNYNNRDFQDQFEVGIESGINPIGDLWLIVKSQIREGIGEKPERADFIRGVGTTYTAHSAQIMWQWKKKIGLSIQYFNYSDLITKRRNLYSDHTISFGIFLEKG